MSLCTIARFQSLKKDELASTLLADIKHSRTLKQQCLVTAQQDYNHYLGMLRTDVAMVFA